MAANIIRLATAAGILIAQAALLYSLSMTKVTSPDHLRDCPFGRPWMHSADFVVPDPATCPHCVWSRIYTFNKASVLLGWILLTIALLSLVYFAASDVTAAPSP